MAHHRLAASLQNMLPTLASFHNMLALWQRQQMAHHRLAASLRNMLPTLASFHNMLALWQRQQMAAARGYNAAIMLR